jgi:hypothetical protein
VVLEGSRSRYRLINSVKSRQAGPSFPPSSHSPANYGGQVGAETKRSCVSSSVDAHGQPPDRERGAMAALRGPERIGRVRTAIYSLDLARPTERKTREKS